jgi:hypothetical protein
LGRLSPKNTNQIKKQKNLTGKRGCFGAEMYSQSAASFAGKTDGVFLA